MTDSAAPPAPFAIDEQVFAYDAEHDQYYDALIKQSRRRKQQWQFLVHYKGKEVLQTVLTRAGVNGDSVWCMSGGCSRSASRASKIADHKQVQDATVPTISHLLTKLLVMTGWNSRYDAWLNVGALFHESPDNAEMVERHRARKQREQDLLKQQQDKTMMSEDNGSLISPSRGGRKRRSHLDGDSTNERPLKVQKHPGASSSVLTTLSFSDSRLREACELPLTLKTVLVDEFERITRKQSGILPPAMLHSLPASTSIHKVVTHFASQQHEPQFGINLLSLFDAVLPKLLLYPQERQQYRQLMSSTKRSASEVYSCEFLLRFLVKLPLLLAVESPSNQAYLCPLLHGLIVLMQKNRASCFKSSFILANEVES